MFIHMHMHIRVSLHKGSFVILPIVRSMSMFSSTGWHDLQKQKVSEAYAGVEFEVSSTSGLRRLREFPRALKNLLLNPTFMFISLAGGAEGLCNRSYIHVSFCNM